MFKSPPCTYSCHSFKSKSVSRSNYRRRCHRHRHHHCPHYHHHHHFVIVVIATTIVVVIAIIYSYCHRSRHHHHHCFSVPFASDQIKIHRKHTLQAEHLWEGLLIYFIQVYNTPRAINLINSKADFIQKVYKFCTTNI